MARTKIKRARTAAAPINDPTPERQRRDTFGTIQAPRMADEVVTTTGRARKQASRVERMKANGWVNNTQARALEIYEEKLEMTGYGNTKSCLNIMPGSGKGLTLTPAALAARDWVAAHEFAVKFSVDPLGVEFVRSVLAPYGGETLADVAERMLPGGQRRRMEQAAAYCHDVAEGLLMGMAK